MFPESNGSILLRFLDPGLTEELKDMLSVHFKKALKLKFLLVWFWRNVHMSCNGLIHYMVYIFITMRVDSLHLLRKTTL